MTASENKNTALNSAGSTKTQSSDQTNLKSNFDVDQVMAKAKIKAVSIAKINQDDRTFTHRDSVTAAFTIEKDVAEAGTLDFATDHPIILQKRNQDYRIISGFRRMVAVAEDGNIKQIRCRVLDAVSDHDAAIIAARCNLSHGKQLTVSEKKSYFLAEQSVRREAGYENLSDRTWARIYGVSPSTIGTWLKKADNTPPENDTPTLSVQIGHSTEEESGSGSNEATTQVESTAKVSEKNQVVHAAGVREAVESLEVAVVMVEEQPRDNLRDQISRLRDLYRRLGYLLKGYESGEEVAA